MTTTIPDFRAGTGFDVHQFATDRKLWLCGVDVPHTHGLLGHSDADVAIHALCDALLGATALRDIGFHFPDTDPKYEGADSRMLLRETVRMIGDHGFKTANADITIIAQSPKISPYIETMRQTIADDLGIGTERVSVKATTTEHLGFTGRKEGIASIATVMVYRI